MRPSALDELGLEAALGNYVREWRDHFGVSAELHANVPALELLDPDVAIHLYRIAQESLNNVSKHANATKVSVTLELRASDVTLVVEDNGRGFDLDAAPDDDAQHLGLSGMRERARLVGGTLEIDSGTDRGTTVFARVPFARLRDQGGMR